jgi:hypothetical protein
LADLPTKKPSERKHPVFGSERMIKNKPGYLKEVSQHEGLLFI